MGSQKNKKLIHKRQMKGVRANKGHGMSEWRKKWLLEKWVKW